MCKVRNDNNSKSGNLTESKHILRSGMSILSPTISSLQTKPGMVLGITTKQAMVLGIASLMQCSSSERGTKT